MKFAGVVHLQPLPGAPTPWPPLDATLARAVADARVLADAGADLAVIENFGDAPFAAGPVGPVTVASMVRVALAVREAAPDLPLAINVLRNDASSALAIAAAVGATWIRVNVHTGAAWTDQGLLTGDARGTLALRTQLGAEVRIAADVAVKHAVPAGETDLRRLAADTWQRGRADALLVTGGHTGGVPTLSDIDAVVEGAPGAPVWVASGATVDNVGQLLRRAQGAIVGTALHVDGDIRAPLDLGRALAMRQAIDRAS